MSIFIPPQQRNGKKEKRKGVIDSFTAGASTGLNMYEDAATAVKRTAYKAMDDEAAYKRATAEHKAIEAENAKKLSGVVQSVDDIRTDTLAHGASDVGSFVGNIAGQAVGAGAGIAGVLLGKTAAGKVLQTAGKYLPMLGKASKLRKAGAALEKAGTTVRKRGNAATSALVAGAATAGQSTNTVLDEGGSAADAAKAGLTPLGLSAAVNYYPSKLVEGKVQDVIKASKKTSPLRKSTKAAKAKSIVKGIGAAATVGGLSEVGDELSQETGRYVGTGNFDMDAKRLRDAFIAGAVGDAGFHAAGNTAEALVAPKGTAKNNIIAALDAGKRDATSVFKDMPSDELATTVADLRSKLLDDAATGSGGMDAGIRLYAAEQQLRDKGDATVNIDDAFSQLSSATDIALGAKDNVPEFDMSHPYSSMKEIQKEIPPSAAAYLYMNLSDGLDSGAAAATRLGIRVKNTGAGTQAVSHTSDTPLSNDKAAVSSTPTQLTDAPDAVLNKYMADMTEAFAKHGIDAPTTATGIGNYGGDKEATTVAFTDAPLDEAVKPAAEVAKKYNQDDFLINKVAPKLTDDNGKYVARPALVIDLPSPITEAAADRVVSEIRSAGISGATLSRDAGGNITSIMAVSYPEVSARYDEDLRNKLLAGDVNSALADEHSKLQLAADRLSASGLKPKIVPVDGVAIGNETYDAPVVEKSLHDRIVSHVRAAELPTAQRQFNKAASEADVFSSVGEYPEHSTYGSFAGRLGSTVPRNTGDDLKIYDIPDEYIHDGNKSRYAVPPKLKQLMDKYGFEHDYFSFEKGEFKAPRFKRKGYKDGMVWIYDPYSKDGSFNDAEYTKTWRITHEIAHGITEEFMQNKYGDSRRQGALGKQVRYFVGDPANDILKTAEPLSMEEALRAVEWEDVAFRVQRRLMEDAGMYISDADFNKEYATNLADAVGRVLTGYFSNPEESGFLPDDNNTQITYAAAIAHIKQVGKLRGVKAGDSLYSAMWRISDARLNDAILAQTASKSPSGSRALSSMQDMVSSVLGDGVMTTLDGNLSSIGEYDTTARAIRISSKLHPSAMLEALDHEMFHALQHTYLSPAELSVVRNAFKDGKPLHRKLLAELRRRGMTEALADAKRSPDEAAAYAFQLFRAEAFPIKGTIAKAWTKLRNTLEAVWNMFRGYGFVSADGIMQAAANGLFSDRAGMYDNALYDGVLDAEASVVMAKEHTKMYRDYMSSADNGSADSFTKEERAAYEDYLNTIGEATLTTKEKWKAIMSGGWRDIIRRSKPHAAQAYVDRLHPLLRIDRDNGATTKHDAKTYMAATEAAHAGKVAYYVMEHGSIRVDENGDIVPDGKIPGLYDILAPVHDIQHIFFPYMIAKRGLRLAEEGKGDGINISGAKAAIKVAEEHPRFSEITQAAEHWYALNTSLMDAALSVGAISKEMRDMLVKHGDYIPFYREVDGYVGAPKQARGADYSGAIGKIRGSDKQMNDPLDNMHRNIAGITQLIASTRALSAVEDALVESDPDTGAGKYKIQGIDGEHYIPLQQLQELEKQGVKVSPVYKDNAVWDKAKSHSKTKAYASDIVTALRKQGIDVSRLSADDRKAVVEFAELIAPKGDDIVAFMYNGRKVYRRVGDPELLRAVKNIAPMSSNAPQWMKTMRNFFVRSIVSFPGFWVANAIRDITTAYAVTDIGLTPHDFVVGFLSSLRRDDMYKEAMLAGALPTVGHAQSRDQQQRALTVSADINTTAKFSRNPVSWLISRAEQGANVAENISRLAVYNRAVEQGMTKQQAGFLARDLLDFGKHGDDQYLLFMIDTVPFLNARIQGLARLHTAVAEHKRRLAAFAGVMMFGSFALAAHNYDDERYRRLTDAEKDNYWHIFFPTSWGRVDHIKIPKPFELGIFASAAERMAQVAFADGDAKLLAQRLIYASMNTLSLNPVPQAALPFLETSANYSTFTGKKIVPAYLEQVDPSMQRTPRTSALADSVAWLAEPLPDIAPLKILKSPLLVDHLVSGVAGTAGDLLKLMSNVIKSHVINGTPAETPRLKQLDPIFGVTRLLGEAIVPSTMDVSMLYVMSGKIQSLEATALARKKTYGVSSMLEYKREHKVEFKYAYKIKAATKRIRQINNDITALYANTKHLPSSVLRDKIDAKLKKRADIAAKLRPLHKIYREIL